MQVSLKSDKNNVYLEWKHKYIYHGISLNSSLEWEMFQIKVVEKVKTRFRFKNIFIR